VVALNLFASIFVWIFVDWFMASFLYCFPYSYCSSNYWNSNSCRSFTLLKALAKSNGNLFAIAFKSDNFREREPSNKKQRTNTKKDTKRIKSDLQRAIEKSPILLSQYWKFELLDSTIIISYFGGSNNIFADCIPKWILSWIYNYFDAFMLKL
jgi:hypothetical protein